MIDLRQVIAGLARGLLAEDYPDSTTIAEALRLDLSHATVTAIRSGHALIRGAVAPGGSSEVEAIATVGPRPELMIFFRVCGPPYRAIERETFGDDQKIQKSRFSEGFAVVFQANGLSYALVADSPDSLVEAAFCRARKAMASGAPNNSG